MKKAKGQSGITLIALVVTIVVLLILAGITITYVLADGGIFSTAKKAAKENEAGVIRDYVSTAQGMLMINAAQTGGTLDNTAALKLIQDNLPTGYKVDGTGLTATTGKFSGDCTITKNEVVYPVSFDANGVATVTVPD